MAKRRFTKEEKLKILQEVAENGKEVTLRKYSVYPSTYYSWRKKYQEDGAGAFESSGQKKKNRQYICKLEDDIEKQIPKLLAL